MDILLLVTIVFSTLYFGMVIYFLVGWTRLKTKPVDPSGQQPFVTVLVPVRNESENIKDCLESLFAQTYPQDKYEVLVIDDFSTDPTIRLAKEFTNENLQVFDLMQYLGNAGEQVPNKKKAIALGIKNAKGELIVTTDGDCTMNEKWLQTLVDYYQTHDYKLVTAPVVLKSARSPFAWFQQLDIINLAGVTGATIRNNFPTMCNGANMIYAKATFHEVDGFKGNHDMPSGDDIFLMRKINARYPNAIGFLKNYDACVFTKPEKTIRGFVSQRVRWLSKSRRFGNFKITALLYFAYFFNLLIIVDAISLVIPREYGWLPIAVAGGTKFICDILFHLPVALFFRKAVLLLLSPFIEVFHTLYIVLIGFISAISGYRWKDRSIR